MEAKVSAIKDPPEPTHVSELKALRITPEGEEVGLRDSQKQVFCESKRLHGEGAVLSHIMPNGSERPIAYASRTLSPAEKKYSQQGSASPDFRY